MASGVGINDFDKQIDDTSKTIADCSRLIPRPTGFKRVGFRRDILRSNWRKSTCKKKIQCRKRMGCKKKKRCKMHLRCKKKAPLGRKRQRYGAISCTLEPHAFGVVTPINFSQDISTIKLCALEEMEPYATHMGVREKGDIRNDCIKCLLLYRLLEKLRSVPGLMARGIMDSRPYLNYDDWLCC